MKFLPIFLDVNAKPCVVIGGGTTALRKLRLLLRARAAVHLVAEEISPEIRELAAKYPPRPERSDASGARTEGFEGTINLRQKRFSETDLDNATLVIAATNDPGVNLQVSELANSRGLPVNVVDEPELCSFIMPAIVDREPITVALSSSATSPVLLRKFKEQIETLIPGEAGSLAEFLGERRAQVKKEIGGFRSRTRFWESIIDGEIPELIYGGRTQEAARIFDEELLSTKGQARRTGEVYLVGAGPGDPDLLTLRALRLMQKADIVLYDRLVSAQIMQRIRPDAQQIHVGKERANHSVPQEKINELLVRLAKEGNRVLRLKGGDPFIFGRGGEEIESLAAAQIPFQVVPGITAASGCAAYAGIPLTHRDYSQSVRFLTGHQKEKGAVMDWEQLAKEQQTLVFYMGLLGLDTICEQLLLHGLDENTGVALIQQGTTADQQVIAATLKTIRAEVAAREVRAPTLIIVGKVVELRDRLRWYGDS